MEKHCKEVRLYGKQVRDWSSPPPASPGIFYSSYEFPTSENGKRLCMHLTFEYFIVWHRLTGSLEIISDYDIKL